MKQAPHGYPPVHSLSGTTSLPASGQRLPAASSHSYNAPPNYQPNSWQMMAPVSDVPPTQRGYDVNGLPQNAYSPSRVPGFQHYSPKIAPPPNSHSHPGGQQMHGPSPTTGILPGRPSPVHRPPVGPQPPHSRSMMSPPNGTPAFGPPPISGPPLGPLNNSPAGTPPPPPMSHFQPTVPPTNFSQHDARVMASTSGQVQYTSPANSQYYGGQTRMPSYSPNAPPVSGPPLFQHPSVPPPPAGPISTLPTSAGQMLPQKPDQYHPSNVNHFAPPLMTTSHQTPPGPGGNLMLRNTVQQPPPSHFPPSGPGVIPPSPGQFPYSSVPGIGQGMGNLGISDKFRPVNIMQEKRLIPEKKHKQKPLRFEESPGDRGLIPPKRKNCNPEVFRSTLNAVPHTQALLNKVKLPLGLIIHPFKDLSSLPVISAGTIVRCKRCRTYINPFVDFFDERRWRCNLCFVTNDVPDEFLHHPVTKTYGEPHTRPECTNATLEFIAPQEYMVRPPQPAVYLFLFDVSHAAVETGYLSIVCDALLEHIDHLPGDARTKIGFLTYNGTVHYYRMAEGASQPRMLIVSDLDDVFVPTPDSLLVNLRERKDLVCDLLRQLPELHEPPDSLARGEMETQSALGAALQAAEKLMAPFGGRVTVFQQELPTTGPGALKPRENPSSRSGDVTTISLNPSTDFYKKLALDSSAHQVAVDFFFMNSQYVDIATLSCTSRFSAGDLHYYPGLHTTHNPVQVDRLSHDLDRYLTRKIGFEAVMRIRCTKGLAVHTFHGNFFVRSTDLLALANINPDAGFGLNLSIEEALTDLQSVSIQAALLYTSSKGERRIRVHTMCFPVAKHIGDVFNAVDSDAVVSLLSKMAVDRSVTASISDARDALVNAVIDALKSYKETVNPGSFDSSLLVPPCMKTLPLMISCLLKHPALRGGVSTRLDDRVFSMIELKMQPVAHALQSIHPDLYRVDNLTDEGAIDVDERIVPQPPLLPLSAESIDRDGVYLLDIGWHMFLHLGPHANREFLQNVIGVKQFSDIEQPMYSLPDLDNPQSESFHNFVEWLQDQRPHHAPMQVVRADSREHYFFMTYMRKDKTESSMSFQEFLQHIKQQMTK